MSAVVLPGDQPGGRVQAHRLVDDRPRATTRRARTSMSTARSRAPAGTALGVPSPRTSSASSRDPVGERRDACPAGPAPRSAPRRPSRDRPPGRSRSRRAPPAGPGWTASSRSSMSRRLARSLGGPLGEDRRDGGRRARTGTGPSDGCRASGPSPGPAAASGPSRRPRPGRSGWPRPGGRPRVRARGRTATRRRPRGPGSSPRRRCRRHPRRPRSRSRVDQLGRPRARCARPRSAGCRDGTPAAGCAGARARLGCRWSAAPGRSPGDRARYWIVVLGDVARRPTSTVRTSSGWLTR